MSKNENFGSPMDNFLDEMENSEFLEEGDLDFDSLFEEKETDTNETEEVPQEDEKTDSAEARIVRAEKDISPEEASQILRQASIQEIRKPQDSQPAGASQKSEPLDSTEKSQMRMDSDPPTLFEVSGQKAQAADTYKNLSPREIALQAAKQQAADRILDTVRKKPPVFSYRNSRDPITDENCTFDDLREMHQNSFLELKSPDSVINWKIVYGKTERSILASNQEIYDIKKEIEDSEEFQKAILSAKSEKDKSPECTVTFKVNNRSKGYRPSYLGQYWDPEEAENSGKPILQIPGQDGRIYEIRDDPVGKFIAPAALLPDQPCFFPEFEFRLPRIPWPVLASVLHFFAEYAQRNQEAMAEICFDPEKQEYYVHVPQQEVTAVSVNADFQREDPLIPVVEIHSHHRMKAVFSEKDNRDEKRVGLYAVVGSLDKFFPKITVRASCAGSFIPVNPSNIFSFCYEEAYVPDEWRQMVTEREERGGDFHD